MELSAQLPIEADVVGARRCFGSRKTTERAQDTLQKSLLHIVSESEGVKLNSEKMFAILAVETSETHSVDSDTPQPRHRHYLTL